MTPTNVLVVLVPSSLIRLPGNVPSVCGTAYDTTSCVVLLTAPLSVLNVLTVLSVARVPLAVVPSVFSVV